ncbi:unnamed protein product [Brassica oleracea var. botrytis]
MVINSIWCITTAGLVWADEFHGLTNFIQTAVVLLLKGDVKQSASRSELDVDFWISKQAAESSKTPNEIGSRETQRQGRVCVQFTHCSV